MKSAPRLPGKAALGVAALGAIGCFPAAHGIPIRSEPDCGPPLPPAQPLASLGGDPAPFDVRRSPEDGARGAPGKEYTYRFEREPTGTEEALRAVVMERGRLPLVVGDHGIALVRDPNEGWKREPTGTEHHLYSVALLPQVPPGGTSEEARKTAPHLAVGAAGTALLRGADGAWHAETTGTEADLFAVLPLGGSALAAGADGVLLHRSAAGTWRPVPTHTRADLYGLGQCGNHLCAAGAAGALVDCLASDDDIVCIPREPPVSASLRAFVDTTFLVGDGVWLGPAPSAREEPTPPMTYAPWSFAPLDPARDDIRAIASNHWSGVSEIFAAGAAGTVWFMGNRFLKKVPFQRLKLPFDVDFHGVALTMVDGFLVGDQGTLVKLGILGFTPPRICLL